LKQERDIERVSVKGAIYKVCQKKNGNPRPGKGAKNTHEK
jgi:hypothetical protein